MSKRVRTALLSAAILAGCLLLSVLIRALTAQREELTQTLEVTSSFELSGGRMLVQPVPPAVTGERVNITSITRYPFGLALVEVGGDGNPGAGPQPPVAVRTTNLEPGLARRRVVTFGTVQAGLDAEIAVEVTGVVRVVHVSLGRRFEAGEPMIELDDRDYVLGLARAEADLARARASAQESGHRVASLTAQVETARETLLVSTRERERWLALAEQSIASTDRLDQAETLWRAARSTHQRLTGDLAVATSGEAAAQAVLLQASGARDVAALALERCVIKAPFAGEAASRLVSVGGFVRPGQGIARLVASGRVRIRAHVREGEALALREGAAVHVTLPGVIGPPARDEQGGYTSEGFPGQLEGVAAAADPSTRKVAIDVMVDNPAGLLRPGSFARLKLEAGDVEQAVLLPDDAIVADEDGHHVFVVVEAVARQVPVTLGWRQGEARLMLSGPEGAFEVVTAGTGLLFDGAPIVRLGD